jgi:hypothetical protein
MWRYFIALIGFIALAIGAEAPKTASPALLQAAIDNWLGERDHWAFTQRAVEYDGDIPHDRVERYDPSKAGDDRWQLLSIDGKPPTAEQREKWAAKKFKRHHRRFDSPLGDFFDFNQARIVAETPQLVRFSVPLRTDKNWLFPVSKVEVRVTINKETRALEHLTAHVREPFKVLMGIARVMGGEADLNFLPFTDTDSAPESAKPTGTAHVSVTKMGERVDFTWSDFKRVNPVRGVGKEDDVAVGSGRDG